MGKKIITHDESDEDLILGSLMKGKRPELEDKVDEIDNVEILEKEIEVIALQKEASKRRKGKHTDFTSIFLKENHTSSRGGKNINIRTEFHRKIAKIIHVIADSDLSFFGYIDNVLEHHFEMYEDEVNELLKKHNQL